MIFLILTVYTTANSTEVTKVILFLEYWSTTNKKSKKCK